MERPADDVRGVEDKPDESDSESPEDTMSRHEELHREHRERLDEHHGRLENLEKQFSGKGEERRPRKRHD